VPRTLPGRLHHHAPLTALRYKGAIPTLPTWGVVTVTGRLSIVSVYELGDFGLTKLRADWLVLQFGFVT
jgi:hypothetical protein